MLPMFVPHFKNSIVQKPRVRQRLRGPTSPAFSNDPAYLSAARQLIVLPRLERILDRRARSRKIASSWTPTLSAPHMPTPMAALARELARPRAEATAVALGHFRCVQEPGSVRWVFSQALKRLQVR